MLSKLPLLRRTLATDALSLYKQTFPKDTTTISQMDAYTRLTSSPGPHTIYIGVFYSGNASSKTSAMVPILLADPLATGGGEWYQAISGRDEKLQNEFIYSPQVAEYSYASHKSSPELSQDNIYYIPSPILSAVYRQRFPDEPANEAPNDIRVTEIKGDTSAYDFLIEVTNDFSVEQLPPSVGQKVLLTVIDNTEYTPPSVEQTPLVWDNNCGRHVIKINSHLARSGIEGYLTNGPSAGGELARCMRESNLFSLAKTVGYLSRTDTLSQWLLREISAGVARAQTTTGTLDAISTKLSKEDVTKFSESVHQELQYEFIPATKKYFDKKLSWWKLYYKNDNVEYDLKDFFQMHYMPKSIEQYNFVRGHIASSLQHQPFSEYSIDASANPLAETKNDVIERKIGEEVQPQVYKIIGSAFVYYQLPVSAVAAAGWMYFDLTTNAATAIGLLGWVVGFNHVSKDWDKFVQKWLTGLFEQIRLTVGKDCIQDGLLEEVKECYGKEIELNDVKKKVEQGVQEMANARVE